MKAARERQEVLMIRKIVSLNWLLSVFFLSLYPIAIAQTPSSPQPPQPLPQNTSGPVSSPAPPGSDEDLSYRIGPGDELDVRVFGRAELSRVVRVYNYGNSRLPCPNEMKAAGHREAQLAGLGPEGYKKYLHDPQVDVLVKEYRSQPVAVIGAVTHPGRFQLQRRARLLELITFAGGPQGRASATIHIVHNSENDLCAQKSAKEAKEGAENGEKSDSLSFGLTSIKLRDLMAGAPDANPFVQPGDVISIPEADQIFVTGSVFKPGSYSMPAKITLTQAVALAGGVNGEGSFRIRLIREQPGNGERREMVYNLSDINRRKIQDVTLMPNDIIEVPNSTLRTASRGVLGVSIGMLNSLPYFILR